MGRYPGFFKRWFGSTTWAETLVMCGINIQVHDTHMHLDDLNHASSLALRSWGGKPVKQSRAELKDYWHLLRKEVAARSPPVPGAQKGKEKDKSKGKATQPQRRFRTWTDKQVLPQQKNNK